MKTQYIMQSKSLNHSLGHFIHMTSQINISDCLSPDDR